MSFNQLISFFVSGVGCFEFDHRWFVDLEMNRTIMVVMAEAKEGKSADHQEKDENPSIDFLSSDFEQMRSNW